MLEPSICSENRSNPGKAIPIDSEDEVYSHETQIQSAERTRFRGLLQPG